MAAYSSARYREVGQALARKETALLTNRLASRLIKDLEVKCSSEAVSLEPNGVA